MVKSFLVLGVLFSLNLFADHDVATAYLARDLQYYAYDPAKISAEAPAWKATAFFDNHFPEGFNGKQLVSEKRFFENKDGFGGVLLDRKNSRDHAILIKGAEVSEQRWEDVEAAGGAGVGQVNEVAPQIFEVLKSRKVFEDMRAGGKLFVIGHSQGAPQTQELGVFLAATLINENILTRAQVVGSIVMRGFGGIGARNMVEGALRDRTKKDLSIPDGLMDELNSVTYLLWEDPARGWAEPYVGTVWIVKAPFNFVNEEWWSDNMFLKDHPRSRYRSANYKEAQKDNTVRRGAYAPGPFSRPDQAHL